MIARYTDGRTFTLRRSWVVEPQQQGRIASELLEALLRDMSADPLLLSACVRRGRDGNTLVAECEWAHRQAFEASARNLPEHPAVAAPWPDRHATPPTTASLAQRGAA